MATPATLNDWLDQLSASILNTSTSAKQDKKRLQDSFRRRVKRHSYVRTNQFEVAGRFDGLEEKFQILTLDNLSDALKQRRNELKEFQNHWLPDVLDLFLHLSGDPARNERLLELYRVPPRIGTPPPLRWRDVLADDPIDPREQLWRVPDFRDTDDSGYDDDDHTFSTPNSALSAKRHVQKQDYDITFDQSKVFYELDKQSATNLINTLQHTPEVAQVTEETLIRQALSLLSGYPVDLFTNRHTQYHLKSSVRVRGISPSSLNLLADQISAVRHAFDIVSYWSNQQTNCTYIAVMKVAAEDILRDYRSQLDAMQLEIISPTSNSAASVIRFASALEVLGTNVTAIASFLHHVGRGDPITCLEKLYDTAQTSQLSCQFEVYQCFCSMLIPSLRAYLQPIWAWLENGELHIDREPFFVRAQSSQPILKTLWHDQYVLRTTGPNRPPAFLANIAQEVLACGKTSAFLSHLLSERNGVSLCAKSTIDHDGILERLQVDHLLSLAASCENSWQETVTGILQNQTKKLKMLLATHCGFDETLDALGQVYLLRDSVSLNEIEMKLFDRVDRCMNSWNDRFQLRDMLEEAFHAQGSLHIPDAITIHAAYTSSKGMQNRRMSVKILKTLALEYVLPWPLANIIDENSMTAYRRVSLVLMQVRRAKYCIERTGYISAMSISLGDDATPADQKFAQVLAFTLLSFLNTLYDHLITTVISPLTCHMRQRMRDAKTVDEMVEAHKDYITRMEYSSLAAPKVRVLRQSLVAMLDLCIRFSDLVSNPAKAQHADSDHEASSFMSALSRNKTLRADQYGSDSDEDVGPHLGEGYSSFIVLQDDTSIVKELRKVQTQFQRQLKFSVAGLKGVSRAGQNVQDLEQLADRLSWNQIR